MKATVDPLILYGVSALRGNEDLPTISHVEAAAAKHLLELAKKDLQPDGVTFTNVPLGKWKQYLKPWVIQDSEPYDILFRPLVVSPTMFFKSLKDRADVVSKKYSSSYRDLSLKLSKYQSFDAHNKELYEFCDEFYTDRLEATVKATLSTTVTLPDDVFADAFFTKPAGVNVKNRILALLNSAPDAANELIRGAFCEKFVCEGLMGIMSSDPALYDRLEADAKPLEMTSNALTDMVQQRILRPNHSKIAMKLEGGQVLQVIPQAKLNAANPQQQPFIQQPLVQGQAANVDGAVALSRKKKREFKASQQQQQQTNNQPSGKAQPFKKTKGPTGAPINTQNAVLGKRLCTYCRAKWPNCTSATFHDVTHCRRDPSSPRYDANFAKTPVN